LARGSITNHEVHEDAEKLGASYYREANILRTTTETTEDTEEKEEIVASLSKISAEQQRPFFSLFSVSSVLSVVVFPFFTPERFG